MGYTIPNTNSFASVKDLPVTALGSRKPATGPFRESLCGFHRHKDGRIPRAAILTSGLNAQSRSPGRVSQSGSRSLYASAPGASFAI